MLGLPVVGAGDGLAGVIDDDQRALLELWRSVAVVSAGPMIVMTPLGVGTSGMGKC